MNPPVNAYKMRIFKSEKILFRLRFSIHLCIRKKTYSYRNCSEKKTLAEKPPYNILFFAFDKRSVHARFSLSTELYSGFPYLLRMVSCVFFHSTARRCKLHIQNFSEVGGVD